ncbi:helix-turn-helix domain-containing protein [Embleya sp. NPDC008237]|uniref:helix-turn-helix domain-containing protein n=1 Tax=Embleya sp. NPDC008237 TaxID=3363978 RepID=UPI0036E97D7D
MTIAREIGHNIRVLREAAGRSLADLAASAGLSKTTLHGIEQGEANPTLSTLWSLAGALDVPLGGLLDGGAPAVSVVRADQGPQVSGEAVHARLLHRVHVRGWVELYELDVTDAEQVSAAHRPGVEECLLVTAGRIETGPLADRRELSTGDSIRFDATGPHVYRGLADDNRAVLLMVHQ